MTPEDWQRVKPILDSALQLDSYISGSIASLGTQYGAGLKAVNCANGGVLAHEQVTAASKERVLDALGNAASKLRGELGESRTSVQNLTKKNGPRRAGCGRPQI